jgi:hypothetical protein
LPLLGIADRDFTRASALGPARLERQPVPFVGPQRPDLGRFLSPQPESGLQLERQRRIGVGDLRQIAISKLARLADIGYVFPPRNAILVVALEDDVLFPDLLR